MQVLLIATSGLLLAAVGVLLYVLLRKKRTPGVTSIADMKAQAAPVVELTGWGEEPIHAQLRRMTLLDLVQQGEVPNELLSVVSEFANDKTKNPFEMKPEQIKKFGELLHLLAQKTLVDPTYEAIRQEVRSFPDDMLLEIWTFCMFGQRELQRFRAKRRSGQALRFGRQVLGQGSERLPAGAPATGGVVS